MKKILNIADVIPSYRIGGLNAMVNQLVESLAVSGYKSDLCHFQAESKHENEYAFNGLINFIKLVSKKRYDVAIVHSIYMPVYPFIVLILKLLGVKVYIQSHGSLSKHSFSKKSVKKILFKPFIASMLLMVDGFIFSNKSEFKNSIIKNEKKVKFLPNLVSGSTGRPTSAITNGKLVFLGKVDFYYKGIDYMLSEIANFRAEQGEIELDIYGYGNDKSLTKEAMLESDGEVIRMANIIRKLNLNDRVVFHGMLNNLDRDSLLTSYEALVLCSASEAMPLVISEALSLGLPVIITRSTNMGEYVEKYQCGFVVDEHKSLSDAILELKSLSDLEKMNMKYNAIKCFKEQLDITLIDDKVRELNF